VFELPRLPQAPTPPQGAALSRAFQSKEKTATAVAEARLASAAQQTPGLDESTDSSTSPVTTEKTLEKTLEKTNGKKLEENDFWIAHFNPGRMQASKAAPLLSAIEFALQGPDYTPNGPSSRALSLGQGGELTLEIADEGELVDLPGVDFEIHGIVPRNPNGKLSPRFAWVGVSETLEDESFHWFECEPETRIIKGCAGVVPTDLGGDTFDLGALGVKRARYIKIRDWGKSASPAEGLTLDAIRLLHAFKKL
jgi:hypothetical protein